MYYHATNVEGIIQLVPRVSSHLKPLVYFTTKRENSLVYLANAVEKYCKEIGYQHTGTYYKWNSYGFDSSGKLILWEYWPDAMRETYAGMAGYIYHAANIPTATEINGIPYGVSCSEPVQIDGFEYVPEAYEALQEAADQGLICIRKYHENNEKKFEQIRRLVQREYVTAQKFPEYKLFLEAKFADIIERLEAE